MPKVMVSLRYGIANDDWACPACSHLTPTQKKESNNFSEQELIEKTCHKPVGSDLGAGRTIKWMEEPQKTGF